MSVIADGRRQTFTYSAKVTVEEVLASAQINLGEIDRVSHPLSLQIADGMLITVRRVREAQECQRESLTFQRRQIPYEGISPGQRQLIRSGKTGIQEACYLTIVEDEIETQRVPMGQPIVISEPLDEITYVGPSEKADPLPIVGRLSYINNETAWTISQNTTFKRPLSNSSGLDSLVFAQNDTGSHLLYTTASDLSDDSFNALWMISFENDELPIKLAPTDVLYAEWRPRTNNAISYSTGEAGEGKATWKSLNNLWLMQIDRSTGSARAIEEIISESDGSTHGWWGTDFSWSPRGDRLAWARADSVGIVDYEEKRLVKLLEFAGFNTGQSWVWLSRLSWSHDGTLLAAAAHGAPLGGEPAETSPVFDLAIVGVNSEFNTVLRSAVGMWAAPTYSPNWAAPRAEFDDGYLAWLQARDSYDSIDGEYDLIVADRDGSNQRKLFPPAGQPGIRSSDFGLSAQDLAWSPDSLHIAVIYLGDLWLVEVATGIGRQITFDGGATNPVWTR